jgi:hypothetical protein
MKEAFRVGLNYSEWLEISPIELSLACEAYIEEEERKMDFLARIITGKSILKKKESINQSSRAEIISFFKGLANK